MTVEEKCGCWSVGELWVFLVCSRSVGEKCVCWAVEVWVLGCRRQVCMLGCRRSVGVGPVTEVWLLLCRRSVGVGL